MRIIQPSGMRQLGVLAPAIAACYPDRQKKPQEQLRNLLKRAAHPERTVIKDVCADHGRRRIGMDSYPIYRVSTLEGTIADATIMKVSNAAIWDKPGLTHGALDREFASFLAL